MAPIARSWMGAILDRLHTWLNGLPPESNSYTIESLHIPISSDMNISADLYQPIGSKPRGTLLIRSPYGIGLMPALGHTRFFAARGYQVLLSSCRGTSGSDGVLEPGANEVADGHAVVEWMRKQPWYTGSFATLGGSYLGYTQWALLTDPPTDMKAAAIFTGPDSFHEFTWGTGALYSNIITWADLTKKMNAGLGFISMMLHLRSQQTRLAPVFDSAPLLDVVDGHFEGDAPEFLRQTISSPEPKSPYWKTRDPTGALERANIPIVLVAGWYDILVREVIEQYLKLTERGCTVALTVGPWTHLGAQGRNIFDEGLPWFEEHLAGRKHEPRTSPVRIFDTGAGEWRDLPRWPPQTSPHQLFLDTGGQLSENKPGADSSDSIFKFDPIHPTPAIGARQMFARSKGKSDEVDALVSRSDVLCFTTEVLEHDLEVCGRPSVQLFHSSNHPHVDLLAVLSEVDMNGISRSISERYLRLDPDREASPLHLGLHDCAHTFRTGTRIRLLLAGGSHPRYIRNLGTGESVATGAGFRDAWHTIRHNASAASMLVLPVSVPDSW
ncbi:uncharacterized protein HMPREF1541_06460 [Cyphellophora europaea CBS 101466]|uniref:Xaa-Pro dipeptidyl-peptidase C-terminal domain-containing protein n=1 Tax=Cyphellophora europaea (strain CBS 101466) TaxID=1220924 RepID=W2RQ55_CYPE1|nr:uncharacterized protein HMPREF1541_06460 [Cyphellophora europaea CBS 101466]ETN38425.1 hypothetical protein HMPREF1541_06460 [Cyphellophora europaea CBS 101466]